MGWSGKGASSRQHVHRKVARTTGVNADMLSAFCAYHEKVPCKHGTERCETTNKRYVADVKKKKNQHWFYSK